MRPSFLPLLINGPFDDPGVFVPMVFHKRALLFDLGDLRGLTPGDLIKTSHAFVSHTHMDHFNGFDHLLRLLLGRAKHLYLFGPQGFLSNVAAKLKAYTWNLVDNYEEGLKITATEIHPDKRIAQSFECRNRFEPSEPRIVGSVETTIHEEAAFQVRAAILDHRIPCLAFALKERFHINIIKASLQDMGLATGRWISLFKEQLLSGTDPQTSIEIPCVDPKKHSVTTTIGDLANRITRITPGQRIAYVADAVYTRENEEKIIALARNADHLFIEAAFLQCHREIAKAKYHLTAHQAGTIARKAGVRKMTVFHHSPRYTDQEHLLKEESLMAFMGRR